MCPEPAAAAAARARVGGPRRDVDELGQEGTKAKAKGPPGTATQPIAARARVKAIDAAIIGGG